MRGTPNILFTESQQFRQTWVWMLVVFVMLLSLVGVLIGFSFVEEARQERWVALGIVLPVDILVLAAMYYTRLETRVTSEGIEVRWWPFMKRYKLYPWSNVERFEMKKSPFMSYGYKYSFVRGTIYNLSNTVGVQLYLRNRKKVFIGSQRTAAIQNAIEEGMRQSKKNL